MSNFFGALTIAGTGTQTFSGVGFQGTEIEFIVGASGGASTTEMPLCVGSVDSSGFVTAQTWNNDGGNIKLTRSTSKCVSLWRRVSGVWTEVINATFHSWTSDGFKLSVTSFDNTVPVEARIRNT